MISRAHFFPGQPLDYKDFNRLSNQGIDLSASIMQKLFPGGGIFAPDEHSSFKVLTGSKSGTLIIEPGYALSANGEFVTLTEPTVVDLSKYIDEFVIVSIRNKEIATDFYKDPDDPRIEGPLSKAYVPEFIFTHEKVPPDAVELCRVYMSSMHFREPTPEEMWQASEIKDEVHSIIDTRFRKSLSHRNLAMSPFDFIALRSSLKEIRDAHRRIQKIYLFSDQGHLNTLLSLLEADLFLKPLPQERISFLVTSVFEEIANYYSQLLAKMERNDQCRIKAKLYELCEFIGPLCTQELYPQIDVLTSVGRCAQVLKDTLSTIENEYASGNYVEEYLIDQRFSYIDHIHDIAIGPYIYKKVMTIPSTKLPSKTGIRRAIKAAYSCGRSYERVGVMCKAEDISFDFKVVDSSKSALLLTTFQQTRDDFEVEFEVNGQKVPTIQIKSSENWVNFGIHIPQSQLSPTRNSIKISIKSVDSYFSLFDFLVYQPGVDL
jgi:hypothetical protein